MKLISILLSIQQLLFAVIDGDFVDKLPKGWHIVGTDSEVNDFSIFKDSEIVWSYKNEIWSAYSSSSELADKIEADITVSNLIDIPSNQGFWIKMEKQVPLINSMDLVGGEESLSFDLDILNRLSDALEIKIYDGETEIYSGNSFSGELFLERGEHQIKVCSKNSDGERCKTSSVVVLAPINPPPQFIGRVDNIVLVSGVSVETTFLHNFNDSEDLNYSIDCQLPNGLYLSNDGKLSGISNENGDFICQISVIDSEFQSVDSNLFSIRVLSVTEMGRALIPYFSDGAYIPFLDVERDKNISLENGDRVSNCYTVKLNSNPTTSGFIETPKIYIDDRETEICSGVESENKIEYLCFREEYQTQILNSPSEDCEDGLIFGFVKSKLFESDRVYIDFGNVVKEYRKGEL